jgi:hypothetical protein
MPEKKTAMRNLSQRRTKREVKPLIPFDPDPMPLQLADLMKGYMIEGPNNPFAAEIEDRDHVLPLSEIEQLAQGDFPSWSALDMILSAIIAANPSNEVGDKERLEQARAALLGRNKIGRRELDDQAMIASMANHYVKLKILDGIEEPKTEEILSAVLESRLWPDRNEGGKDIESWKAVRKRLRQKFEASKNLYLAAETAFSHPEQKKRWAITKQIILLLEELSVVAPVK